MAAKRQRQQEERTFIAVKPDGVQRGLVGEIVKRFEQRGYKLVAAKLCRVRTVTSVIALCAGRFALGPFSLPLPCFVLDLYSGR
ncbi:hypothetical protein ACOMHN_031501 [Nucella lapillus]